MQFLPIIRLIDRILGPFFQKNIKIRVFSKKWCLTKKKKGPCQATPTPSSERVSTHIPIFPQIPCKNQKIEKIGKIQVGSTILISDSAHWFTQKTIQTPRRHNGHYPIVSMGQGESHWFTSLANCLSRLTGVDAIQAKLRCQASCGHACAIMSTMHWG